MMLPKVAPTGEPIDGKKRRHHQRENAREVADEEYRQVAPVLELLEIWRVHHGKQDCDDRRHEAKHGERIASSYRCKLLPVGINQ